MRPFSPFAPDAGFYRSVLFENRGALPPSHGPVPFFAMV